MSSARADVVSSWDNLLLLTFRSTKVCVSAPNNASTSTRAPSAVRPVFSRLRDWRLSQATTPFEIRVRALVSMGLLASESPWRCLADRKRFPNWAWMSSPLQCVSEMSRKCRLEACARMAQTPSEPRGFLERSKFSSGEGFSRKVARCLPASEQSEVLQRFKVFRAKFGFRLKASPMARSPSAPMEFGRKARVFSVVVVDSRTPPRDKTSRVELVCSSSASSSAPSAEIKFPAMLRCLRSGRTRMRLLNESAEWSPRAFSDMSSFV
mmetsp:Transcript_34665/g.73818  ORF Transcript_34665/g.73818 Transcript_34665/m.73818 type:complete len:266 (+) Transcript_34665:934-1731(+)